MLFFFHKPYNRHMSMTQTSLCKFAGRKESTQRQSDRHSSKLQAVSIALCHRDEGLLWS